MTNATTAICIAKTNTCCNALGGPGITGTTGRPSAAPETTPPAPTSTSTQDPSGSSSWTCTRQDSGEACCQRAPVVPLHWCSGEFPQQRCYNAENQFCCTDGTVCDEEGCCELFVGFLSPCFYLSLSLSLPFPLSTLFLFLVLDLMGANLASERIDDTPLG